MTHRSALLLLAVPTLAIVAFVAIQVARDGASQSIEIVAVREPKSFWGETLLPAEGSPAAEASLRVMLNSARGRYLERSAIDGAHRLMVYYGTRAYENRAVYVVTGDNLLRCPPPTGPVAGTEYAHECYWTMMFDATTREPMTIGMSADPP